MEFLFLFSPVCIFRQMKEDYTCWLVAGCWLLVRGGWSQEGSERCLSLAELEMKVSAPPLLPSCGTSRS